MSIAFYMDVNVRRALTEALRLRGVDVLTAQEDGAAKLPDPLLLDRATALGRVLFTHDRDFLREAVLRQKQNEAFTGVIYAHQIETTLAQCLNDLLLIAQAGELEDLVNCVEYLPLSHPQSS